MNPEFPFQVAYDHVAQKLLMDGLPPDNSILRSATIVFIENTKVYRSTVVPGIDRFIDSEHGTAALGHFTSEWVKTPQESPSKDFCLVVAIESYMQLTDAVAPPATLEDVQNARDQLPDSLAGHPDSCEVVVITVHHRSGIRMGALLIKDDRTLEYRPLYKSDTTFGRLTPNAASGGAKLGRPS